MSLRTRESIGLGAVLALLLAAPAAAQPPPCAPGVAGEATLRGYDTEDSGGPLTATHTILLELDSSSDGPVEDFTATLPPGAEARRVGGSPAFRVNAPGPVPVTATWAHFDAESGSDCTASAETTLVIEAARAPRFIPPPRSALLMTELNWRLRVGENYDLRPLEARLRGVRRARLPRASAPVQTVTYVFRRGDKGLKLTGTGRVLRSANWKFHFDVFYLNEIRIRMHGVKKSRQRGFGFELELVQAGRQIGRTRAVGRCRFTVVGPLCRYRTVR